MFEDLLSFMIAMRNYFRLAASICTRSSFGGAWRLPADAAEARRKFGKVQTSRSTAGSSFLTVLPCRIRLPATSAGWGMVVQQREQISISAGAPFHVEAAHSLHFRQSPRSRSAIARRSGRGARAIEHVALAARVDIAVVFNVCRTAPEIVAWMLPVTRGMAGVGPH